MNTVGWFRNPANHVGGIKTLVINGDNLPLNNWFAGFLNHQPYRKIFGIIAPP